MADPKLSSDFLVTGGAGNVNLVNELIHRVGAGMISVKDRDLTAPPGSPADGDAYIIPTGATGAWAGTRTNHVAVWVNGSWEFLPQTDGGAQHEGLRVEIQDENLKVVFDGTQWRPDLIAGYQTLTDGATINWPVTKGRGAQVTLGGNRTMAAPTALHPGDWLSLGVLQDGTGNRTITWDTVFEFPGGTAPTLSTGAGAKDVLNFFVQSTGSVLYTGGQFNLS